MKFARHLENEGVPEWRKVYIDYHGLKKRLKHVEKFRRSSEHRAATELDNAFQEFDTTSAQEPNRPRNGLPHNIWFDTSPLQRHLSFPHALMRKISARFRAETELSRIPSHTASLRSSATLSVFDEVLLHASEPERAFFHMLDGELEKISRFYNEKESEALAKLDALRTQIHLSSEYMRYILELEAIGDRYPGASSRRPSLLQRLQGQDNDFKVSTDTGYVTTKHHMSYDVARNRLKKALTEFYRSLEYLRSYKILNETGFQKILKKFDKTAGWKASGLYHQRLQKYHWVVSRELDDIISETETLYINEFADGQRRRGMRKLRLPEKKEDYGGATWRVGFLVGISVSLLFHVCMRAFDPKLAKMLPNVHTSLQIYACFILPILFCLGFSLNLFVWHRFHINYKFIFELDPRHNLDYHQFAELPAFLLLITAYVMHIDFSQAFAPTIPSELWPLILFIVLMAILFCPFDIFYASARKWLGETLGRIVLSFCFRVEFRDFFIADEINSLSYSFWTLPYFFCAYQFHWSSLDDHCSITQAWFTPILASLPPWWRFLQCLRRFKDSNEQVHLINGAKYLSSILATIIGAVRRMHSPSYQMDVVWILASIANSCYTTTWDVKMDWGLLQPNSQYWLLRDELVFHRWAYYLAIPMNAMLRFSWTLGLMKLRMNGQVLAFIIAFVEMIRRLVWNIFRLEHEHLNNCGQLRVIKDIPLPFAFEHCKMPENEDGSIHLPLNPKTDPIPIICPTSTRNSYVMDSASGSFYGRRDFENRHDHDELTREGVLSGHLVRRQPSTLSNMLTRIQSIGAGHQSDSDRDEDDDEDEDEDEDMEITIGSHQTTHPPR